jgi:hypothetical protein
VPEQIAKNTVPRNARFGMPDAEFEQQEQKPIR